MTLTKDEIAINQDLKGLLDIGKVNPKYLLYWLKSKASFIESSGTGATVKGVKLDFVRNLLCPLTTPTTQEKIVMRLSELQEKTQANKQVLQQKLEQLQQLKASLLDSAFRGEI